MPETILGVKDMAAKIPFPSQTYCREHTLKKKKEYITKCQVVGKCYKEKSRKVERVGGNDRAEMGWLLF